MSWGNILKELAKAAIPMIIETVGDFLKKFNAAPQMTETNSVTDIEKINDAVSILREQVLKQGNRTIQAANDYVVDYVNEQLFDLEDKAALLKKYQISFRDVERRLKKIKNRLGNFWQDAIYKKISLDNPQCRALLKMPAGIEKENATVNFAENVLQSALNEYAEEIAEELGNLYVDLEKDIANSVAQLEKTVQEYEKLLTAVDESDEQKFEKFLADAYEKVFVCEKILAKVEG